MAMVSVVNWQPTGGLMTGAVLYSSHEPGEL